MNSKTRILTLMLILLAGSVSAFADPCQNGLTVCDQGCQGCHYVYRECLYNTPYGPGADCMECAIPCPLYQGGIMRTREQKLAQVRRMQQSGGLNAIGELIKFVDVLNRPTHGPVGAVLPSGHPRVTAKQVLAMRALVHPDMAPKPKTPGGCELQKIALEAWKR